MTYLDLYQSGAAASGATTVSNDGLGMTPAERTSVAGPYRKRKKRPTRREGTGVSTTKLNAFAYPAALNKTPEP